MTMSLARNHIQRLQYATINYRSNYLGGVLSFQIKWYADPSRRWTFLWHRGKHLKNHWTVAPTGGTLQLSADLVTPALKRIVKQSAQS